MGKRGNRTKRQAGGKHTLHFSQEIQYGELMIGDTWRRIINNCGKLYREPRYIITHYAQKRPGNAPRKKRKNKTTCPYLRGEHQLIAKLMRHLNLHGRGNTRCENLDYENFNVQEIWNYICTTNPKQKQNRKWQNAKEGQQKSNKKPKTNLAIEDYKYPPHQIKRKIEIKTVQKNNALHEIKMRKILPKHYTP